MRTIPRGRRLITDIILALGSSPGDPVPTDSGDLCADSCAADRYSLGTLSDSLLLTAVHQGAPDALAELYERHGQTVRAHAHVRFAAFGPVESDNVTRSVFLELWHSVDMFVLTGNSLKQQLLDAVDRRYLRPPYRPLDAKRSG